MLEFSVYGSPLAEQLCNETSGDFRHLLTLILTVSTVFFSFFDWKAIIIYVTM